MLVFHDLHQKMIFIDREMFNILAKYQIKIQLYFDQYIYV